MKYSTERDVEKNVSGTMKVSRTASLWNKIKPMILSYLVLSGVFFIFVFAVFSIYGLYKLNELNVTFEDVANKVAEKTSSKMPMISNTIKAMVRQTNNEWDFSEFDMGNWQGKGANDEIALDGFPKTELLTKVSSTSDFLKALNTVKSGGIIVLASGIYKINKRSIYLKNSGTYLKPIKVIGAQNGGTIIELNTLEGFYVDKPFWQFENLRIKGVCVDDSRCEHAFHIVGKAKGTIIKNNKISGFNALIKANGIKVGQHYYYPDNGVINNNMLYNHTVRNTGNPVTLLDMVGVNDWVVSDNLIADFMKEKSNRISYGTFFKGNGFRNTFERNLVICRLKLPLADRVQVGLSFGGGATILSACRNQKCDVEHTAGMIRHNIIMNCNDVAIYLNKSKDTEIYNNTLINTLGIDVRFPESSAVIANNFLTGRIKSRNGGESQEINNMIVEVGDLNDVFVDPLKGDFSLKKKSLIIDEGVNFQERERDFCGKSRGPDQVDIGAFEFEEELKVCNPFHM